MALPQQAIDERFLVLVRDLWDECAERAALAELDAGASLRSVRMVAAAALGLALAVPMVVHLELEMVAAWATVGTPALVLGAIVGFERLARHRRSAG